MAEYWIQIHDYSSTTHRNVSSDEAKAAFAGYDWESELQRFDENDPDRNCPPGIGVNNGIPLTEEGAILLHVCPLDAETAQLHIHCSLGTKFLGIFSGVDQAVNSIDSIERARIPELIDLVFSGDAESLLAVT